MTGEPLHAEHIVPFCLGGSWILYKASCPKCEEVTREFERCVTSEQALVIRTVENLPTRRKERRPKTLPLNVTKAGQEETIDCPIDMYPIALMLEVYDPLAYVDKRPYKTGIGVRVGTVGPAVERLQRLHDVFKIDSCSSTISLQGLTQARLLAKIALGFTVAAYGTRVIKNAYIRRAILGQSGDIGKWVGCTRQPPPATNALHEVRLGIRDNNIHAFIRLFARHGTPEYLVIVGPAP